MSFANIRVVAQHLGSCVIRLASEYASVEAGGRNRKQEERNRKQEEEGNRKQEEERNWKQVEGLGSKRRKGWLVEKGNSRYSPNVPHHTVAGVSNSIFECPTQLCFFLHFIWYLFHELSVDKCKDTAGMSTFTQLCIILY